MRALIFQHSEKETPGTFLEWLRLREHATTVHHWYASGAAFKGAPQAAAHDWLIVLGGTMNVDEEEKYPWLKQEKAFVREWLETGKPLLGICLGAQILAQALGGNVKRNREREIGFQPVTKTGEHPAFARWPVTLPVYQYHEDFFTLPPGCESLASSPACAHQAFARGRSVLGLQFHPESTPAWIEGNAHSIEKQPGEKCVQTPAETAVLVASLLPALTECFFRLLDDFFGG